MTLQVSSLTYGQLLTIVAEFHKVCDPLSAESTTETRTNTNETVEALSIIIGRETSSIALP